MEIHSTEVILRMAVVVESVLVFYSKEKSNVGLHLAERSLFLNLSRLLWGFNIEHATDEKGNIIPIDFSLETGILPGGFTVPKPFAAKITSRSPERARILKEQWEVAQKNGVDFSDITFDKVGNVKV